MPRPSSPLGAKASTRCPSHPRPAPATTARGRLWRTGSPKAPHTGPSQEPADEQQPTSGRPPHPKVPKAAIKSIPMPKQRAPKTERPAPLTVKDRDGSQKTGAHLLASARSRRSRDPIDPEPANELTSPLHDVKRTSANAEASRRTITPPAYRRVNARQKMRQGRVPSARPAPYGPNRRPLDAGGHAAAPARSAKAGGPGPT